ncbi:MAG: 50S ribosomal protein L10 [Clostridiales bacterium]|nr:50S ribosomal protein L10 [Clostridiales bacterium]
MPSEKVLESKKQIVADLTETLKSSVAGVLVDYKGINVADDTKLRKELREAGVEYSVVKNTMLRFAAKEAGLEVWDEFLHGTTALAVSKEDPIIAAKIVAKYVDAIKGDVFTIKSGFMDGKVIDTDTVNALAKIPTKEVLIATMLSSLNATISKFAVVIDQIAKKKEEEVA